MATLTQIKGSAYDVLTAEKNAVGIDVLKTRGAKPSNIHVDGYFFACYHAKPSTGCCTVGPKGPPDTLTGTSTLCSIPPPIDVGPATQRTKRQHPMKQIPHGALALAIRIFKFISSCIRLRSISAALWIDAYDNAGGSSK